MLLDTRRFAFNYIPFIDEAGDSGLEYVKPIDPSGATEWLIAGAYVVRAVNLDGLGTLHQSMLASLKTQRSELHYRHLSARKRISACTLLATAPARGIVIASNKKNMRRYQNERAARVRSQDWFYNWCMRLLIERITQLCVDDAAHRGIAPTCRIIFSERGNFSYAQMEAYYSWMRGKGSNLFRTGGEVRWEALTGESFDIQRHEDVPGLQFADLVTSAFYDAVDTNRPRAPDILPASALKGLMAKRHGRVPRFGVSLWPTNLVKADLNRQQKLVFEHYGYKFPNHGEVPPCSVASRRPAAQEARSAPALTRPARGG